jgi:hypothetical protein
MTKRTTITIEVRSLLVLLSCNSINTWCPLCGAEVEAAALKDTGVISNVEQRALEDWLLFGEFHQFTAPDGSLLLCLSSLLARAQKTKPADCGTPRLPGTEKERT